MRILYVTEMTLERDTAPAIHVAAVAGGLARGGLDVTVLGPRPARPHSLAPARTSFVPGSGPLGMALFQVLLLARLWRMCRAARPDALYVRQGQGLVVPTLVAHLLRIPTVVEVNGHLLAEARAVGNPLVRFALATGLLAAAERYVLRRATRVIAVTVGIVADLVHRHGLDPGRCQALANGVDADRFQPQDQAEARAELGLAPEPLLAVFVGALWPWQNLDLLVDAVARARAAGADVACLIAGDGPELAALRDQARAAGIADQVTFTGQVPHFRVPTLIAAADVCVYYPVPERGAGASPMKIYEYLACGRRVIAADLPGVREEFGEHLDYCAAGDASALAEAFAQGAARVSAEGRAPHREGRVFVVAGRSWAAVAARTEAVLRDTVREHSGQVPEQRVSPVVPATGRTR